MVRSKVSWVIATCPPPPRTDRQTQQLKTLPSSHFDIGNKWAVTIKIDFLSYFSCVRVLWLEVPIEAFYPLPASIGKR